MSEDLFWLYPAPTVPRPHPLCFLTHLPHKSLVHAVGAPFRSPSFWCERLWRLIRIVVAVGGDISFYQTFRDSHESKSRNEFGSSALGSILGASPSPCSTIFLLVSCASSGLWFLGFSYHGFSGVYYQSILFYIFLWLFLCNFLSVLLLVSFTDTGIISCLLISHLFHKRNKLHCPWPSLSIFCSLWAYAEALLKTARVHWALIKP